MDLSKALIDYEETGIIKIKSKKELKVIEELKINNMLNLSKLSKDVLIDEGLEETYYAFIPKISTESFYALCSSIEDFYSKFKTKEHDIILTKAHSKKDGAEIKNILKILNS